MAAPTLVGSPGITNIDSINTTHALNLPTGRSTGNTMLAISGRSGGTIPTFLSGWTTLLDYTSANTDPIYIASRVIDGTESATATYNTSVSVRSMTNIYQINGLTGTIQIATPAELTNDPPNLTLSPAGSLDTLWVAVALGTTSNWAWVAPTNYGSLTDTGSASSTATSRLRLGTCFRTLTAAAENPGAFTFSGTGTPGSVLVLTIALPAAGGSAVYPYTGSGGLIFAGTAVKSKTKSFPVSGGIVLGGTASLAKSKVPSVSGGIVLGGVATIAKVKAVVGSGGLILGGIAGVSSSRIASVAGGISFGGVATTQFVPAGPQTYSYTGSGGITFGGSAFENITQDYVGSGGITFGGSAVTSYVDASLPPIDILVPGGIGGGPRSAKLLSPLRTYVYEPSGGIVFGGSAAVVFSPATPEKPFERVSPPAPPVAPAPRKRTLVEVPEAYTPAVLAAARARRAAAIKARQERERWELIMLKVF